MKGNVDYLLAQLLSLVFGVITLATYHRARRAYAGGKVGAALHLVFLFLVVLLVADLVDYFLPLVLPADSDLPLIGKMILRLTAVGVLFFGGLRFFAAPPRPAGTVDEAPSLPTETAPDTQPLEAGTVELPTAETTRPTLGRYEIVGEIGRGASGLVYKGIDPKLQRTVAIKTVRFDDDYDDQEFEKVRDQFYREAHVLANLSHPNIVSVFDVGEDMDMTYLALEYLEGESLEPFTRKGLLLNTLQCLRIARQICEALDYLHANGIVHRDVKPSNIMLLKDGQVKLADFGIARAMATGTRSTTEEAKGTPFYMSPEQVQGERLTGASDIFSLGVVLYQLLSGALPFEAENMSAVMYQITQVPAKPISAHNPDLDAAIVAVVERALQKSPDLRFASARQMAEALRQAARSMRMPDDELPPAP